MGSTTPPKNPHNQECQPEPPKLSPEVASQLNNEELLQLLEQRDLEILQLRRQLERYKLALVSLGLGKEQLGEDGSEIAVDNVQSLLETTSKPDLGPAPREAARAALQADKSLSKEISSQIINPSSSGKVIFKTGADEDEDEDDDGGNGNGNISGGKYGDDDVELDEKNLAETTNESVKTLLVSSTESEQSNCGDDKVTSSVQEIIQDVDDIDLDLKLNKKPRRRRKQRKEKSDIVDENKIQCDINDGSNLHDDNDSEESDGDNDYVDDDDDDDDDARGGEADIITEGLLTSLTDAAISNLSQLAALQERCESQQQHSQPKSLSNQQFQAASRQVQSSQGASIFSCSLPRASVPTSTSNIVTRSASRGDTRLDDDRVGFNMQDPFAVSNLASQAALALSASNDSSSLIGNQVDLDGVPISVGSAIQSSRDLNTDQSLTSVVVAAAAAAAAAGAVDVDEHHRHHHAANKQHQLPTNQPPHDAVTCDMVRLVSPLYSYSLQLQLQLQ